MFPPDPRKGSSFVSVLAIFRFPGVWRINTASSALTNGYLVRSSDIRNGNGAHFPEL